MIFEPVKIEDLESTRGAEFAQRHYAVHTSSRCSLPMYPPMYSLPKAARCWAHARLAAPQLEPARRRRRGKTCAASYAASTDG